MSPAGRVQPDGARQGVGPVVVAGVALVVVLLDTALWAVVAWLLRHEGTRAMIGRAVLEHVTGLALAAVLLGATYRLAGQGRVGLSWATAGTTVGLALMALAS